MINYFCSIHEFVHFIVRAFLFFKFVVFRALPIEMLFLLMLHCYFIVWGRIKVTFIQCSNWFFSFLSFKFWFRWFYRENCFSSNCLRIRFLVSPQESSRRQNSASTDLKIQMKYFPFFLKKMKTVSLQLRSFDRQDVKWWIYIWKFTKYFTFQNSFLFHYLLQY